MKSNRHTFNLRAPTTAAAPCNGLDLTPLNLDSDKERWGQRTISAPPLVRYALPGAPLLPNAKLTFLTFRRIEGSAFFIAARLHRLAGPETVTAPRGPPAL